MPQGENLTLEHQKAAARKHGVYALVGKPLSEWPEDDRALAVKIAEDLDDPELLEVYTKLLAGMALTWCEKADTYARTEAAAAPDTPLDEIAIVKSLPAFINTAGRRLKAVHDMQKANPDGRMKNVTEALDSMKVNDDAA